MTVVIKHVASIWGVTGVILLAGYCKADARTAQVNTVCANKPALPDVRPRMGLAWMSARGIGAASKVAACTRAKPNSSTKLNSPLALKQSTRRARPSASMLLAVVWSATPGVDGS